MAKLVTAGERGAQGRARVQGEHAGERRREARRKSRVRRAEGRRKGIWYVLE